MNLSTLALPQSSNLHPWKIPEACPDNWHAAANLNRFQCNIKIDGKDCTVEFASNKDLNRLASTQSLAVLLHGYGVGGSSMMTLCEPLNDYDEPFICPNLLGAGSVFPSDFKFTPQNISQIYASMIRAISPNALTIFGFGNSMGGMFMEGT
ncbi:MAG: hypothetical protein IPJ69_02680 [Deltaproteobacteria bacterium]|nr:MAG: hypothetical protein IPJ69_02680 [Deltaproteobacteria bacterium]